MAKLDTELFTEPTSESSRAGLRTWERIKSPYLEFIESEGIPIYKGIGVRNIRELDLGDWSRLGAKGAFLYLDGLDGIKGMYVLEVPARGVTTPMRQLYHEFYLVLEGRGTTETRAPGSKNTQVIEWQPGSLMYFPPNVEHRLINATDERVLVLAANNAPPIWNIHRDADFIFNNDYIFKAHYSEDPDFYRYDEKIYQVPLNRRAQTRSNFYPDIINAELPLDNQRLPGYRRIQPGWRGFEFDHGGFISQYPPGRYSRAHFHAAGAVLVCLRGAGYTFNWHRELGPTPWKDGNADQVRVQEYVQGGLVAAAPGGGNWFHQHFNVSREHFRVINYWGGPTNVRGSMGRDEGHDSGEVTSGNLNIREGGSSIAYSDEDPYVRATFEEHLAREGLKTEMPEELYTTD
ncbi:MAG: cupin domain-containing protein [Acidimicrobiaceae bacterium]|nr:cupin domain-containing protein [Acidimicrobiaceae bacterium]